jgi:glycosyltransferase involved in cell wall biosynthesis
MDNIFIAIATCHRNDLLKKTLLSIEQLAPFEFGQIHVFVGDNDPAGGAAETVLSLGNKLGYKLSYVHCPKPGIPQVRNVLLAQALTSDATALAFIDDDEMVDPNWLHALWRCFAQNRHQVHAVHGPIVPLFAIKPPRWLPIELYGRDLKLPTGTKLHLAATGNVLIDLSYLRKKGHFFDERMALTGGSDTEFFHRFTKDGGVICWCNEARVCEHVPESRMTIYWLCRRYFRRGSSDMKFWRLNHSFLYTFFWGWRRAVYNFCRHFVCLLAVGKTKRYYIEHLVCLMKTVGLLSGIFGFSYLEYAERHRKL